MSKKFCDRSHIIVMGGMLAVRLCFIMECNDHRDTCYDSVSQFSIVRCLYSRKKRAMAPSSHSNALYRLHIKVCSRLPFLLRGNDHQK